MDSLFFHVGLVHWRHGIPRLYEQTGRAGATISSRFQGPSWCSAGRFGFPQR